MFESRTLAAANGWFCIAISVRNRRLGIVTAMTTPNPPPESDLVRRKHKNRVPKLTAHAAAQQSGVSYATWRNITRGLRYRDSGEITTYRPESEVLARVALVLGITPDELRDVNRHDAARALEATLRSRSPLSAFTSEQLLSELATRLREDDPYGLGNAAPTIGAEVTSAHYGLAAMTGTPDHAPDAVTGEESQVDPRDDH